MDTMNARARLVYLLLLGLAACTAERQVLDNPAGVLTSCDQAWNGGPGIPCSFTDRCMRASPAEPACCTDLAACVSGTLELSQSCRPECNCTSDSACIFGQAICEGRCQACPPTDFCSPCPPGWVPLARNGCPTCRCGPPPGCDMPELPCDAADPTILCYAGASCADGCDASVPGCCSNTCAAGGCAEPAPIGCFTNCPDGSNCGLCATERCSCTNGVWECTAVCAENVTISCQYP
jgi:hypothetical protein